MRARMNRRFGAVFAGLVIAVLPPSAVWAKSVNAEATAPDVAAQDGAPGEEAELSTEQVLQLAYGFEPGPKQATVGRQAEVAVPEGFLFTGVEGTRKFLEATGNIVNNRELGILYHGKEGFFIVLEFEASGYVKDDDKDELDADAMLESIKQGTASMNDIRRERGEPTMEITGWYKAPLYNESTHNLEWAPLAKDSTGEDIVNYNVRVLGRRGVMEVALVAAPDQMASALPQLRTVLSGFKFVAGEDYASFTSGDKIAEYGLTGLVAGGAVAVAAKSGLLGRLWKFILIGVIALGGFVKKLFGGKSAS